jgi:hypothetical protein
MKPSQAKVLLHIAENTSADGEEVLAESNRVRQLLIAHAKRILEDEELLIQAWELNQKDKERFVQYMPPEYRQQRGQAALGNNLAQQRAALGVIKDEKRTNSEAKAGS